MAGTDAELAFVATMRDEASAVARSARKTMDSVGGDVKPITAKLAVDAAQAKAATDEIEDKLRDLPPIGEEEGDKTGKGLGEGIAAGLSGAKGKILGAIGALGIGAALVEGIDQDAASDKLAASLGAGPGLAKKYGDIAGRIYAGAWGDSMEDVNLAIASVKTSFRGLGSGRELEAATTKALDYAAIFDIDVVRAANTAGLAVKSGLAKNATQAFDLLTAASQKVPVQLREDVLDASDEYGQFFAGLGFTGPQAFGALAAGAAKGMYGIDKAGDAVKEFTIRSTDMSKTSVDAYKSIGLDAQTMANRILKGGKTAKGATDQIVKGILGIEDPATRANTAIALFGTPLEDLNVKDIPAFLKSLVAADGGLGKVEGASKRAGQTLNDNAKTNLVSFARQVKQTAVNVVGGQLLPKLSEVASTLATKFGPAFNTAKGIVKSVTGFLQQHSTTAKILAGVLAALIVVTAAHSAVLAVAAAGGMAAWLKGTKLISGATKVWAAVQWAMNAALAANPIVLIVLAIVALVAIIVVAWKKSDAFRGAVLKAWAAIKGGVMKAVDAVKGAISKAWAWITSASSKTWNAIKSGISSAWNAIKGAVSSAVNGVKSVISRVFGAIGSAIRAYLNAYKTVVLTVWNAIKAVVSTVLGGIKSVVTSGFSNVKAAISTALNTVKTLFSNAWNAIKTGFSNGISKLVTFAKGIGGKIKGAIGNAKDLLLGIGGDIIGGLVSGISGGIDRVTQAVRDLAGKIPGPIKKLLGIASPSKVFRQLGLWTVDGFVEGLDAGSGEVDTTLGKLATGVRKFFTKRIEDDKKAAAAAKTAIKHLRDESNAVRENAKAHDTAVASLDVEKEKLKELVDARKEYVDGVKSSIQSFASIADVEGQAIMTVNVETGELEDTGEKSAVTAGDLTAALTERRDTIAAYQRNLQALRNKGVDDAIIRSLEEAGVAQGSASAAALASASSAQIDEINRIQGEINASAAKAAEQSAAHWHDTGIAAAEGLVKGAEDALGKVEDAGRRLARALRRALRKELGIHSPSRVMAEQGGHVAAGLAKGILDDTRLAENAARSMADRVASAATPSLAQLQRMSTATTVFGSTSEVVTIRHEVAFSGDVPENLSADEVARLIAKDPKSADRLERALAGARNRRAASTITASDS